MKISNKNFPMLDFQSRLFGGFWRLEWGFSRENRRCLWSDAIKETKLFTVSTDMRHNGLLGQKVRALGSAAWFQHSAGRWDVCRHPPSPNSFFFSLFQLTTLYFIHFFVLQGYKIKNGFKLRGLQLDLFLKLARFEVHMTQCSREDFLGTFRWDLRKKCSHPERRFSLQMYALKKKEINKKEKAFVTRGCVSDCASLQTQTTSDFVFITSKVERREAE